MNPSAAFEGPSSSLGREHSEIVSPSRSRPPQPYWPTFYAALREIQAMTGNVATPVWGCAACETRWVGSDLDCFVCHGPGTYQPTGDGVPDAAPSD